MITMIGQFIDIHFHYLKNSEPTQVLMFKLAERLEYWNKYNKTAEKYIQNTKEYEEFREYFKKGDWSTH